VDNDIETLYHSTLPHYPELKGQVAVVTGAAQGIGQGIAVRLAREEMRVVIADKDPENLASTVSALRRLGCTILGFLGDLSQPDVIQQLFEQTINTFQNVHLLVNNAADIQRKRLLDEHEACWIISWPPIFEGRIFAPIRPLNGCRRMAVEILSISHLLERCGPMKWAYLMMLPRAPLMR
jgi:NAD(P)-dependent dehydrogenase (short-subunit alcohol dehydrogenase family)